METGSILLLFLLTLYTAAERQAPGPANPRRLAGSFDWCDCGTGSSNVTVWTDEPKVSLVSGRLRHRVSTWAALQVQVVIVADSAGDPQWINWGRPVQRIHWQ